MKCKNWGNELEWEDIFCQSCDAKDNTLLETELKKEISKKKKSRKKRNIIIGCIVLFLAIVAVCAYFFLPREMKVEVQELADAVNNNTINEYYFK